MKKMLRLLQLLVLLGVAAWFPALSADVPISPADVTLDLGPSDPSYLGVSCQELATDLCGYSSGGPKDPKLLAANDGGQRAVTFAVEGARESPDGLSIAVDLTTIAFATGGAEPLSTHCGEWDYRVILEPLGLQQLATLTLHRATATALVGVFTGSVPVSTRMVFTSKEGQVREYALDLTLELQGPWASVHAAGGENEGRGGPPPGTPSLVLFTVSSNGRFVPAPTPNVQYSIQYSQIGQLVLQADAASVTALNTDPRD